MTSETSERLPSHKVLEKSCDSMSQKDVKKESKTSERLPSHENLEKSCDSISQKHVKKESKTSERLPSHETLEKSCDNISKKEIETVNHPFTRPKTPRRRSCRISGVSNLRKDDSWVSRDMFESDIEDERPKSRLNSSREVDNDDGEIVVRNPDQVHFSISESVKIRKDRASLSPGKSYADTPPRRSKGLKTKDGELSITKDRVLTNPKDRESLSPVKNCSMVTDQVFHNISESVKTRRDRKSLTPVNSTKPARKSREIIECDPGYVTPSLPRTKLLEITKWLTDSEKSIRQLPPSAKGIPPPLIEEPIEEIVISDSCSEGGDKVKTPPKAKTDKHHATDKQKTRNRTKTDKRSKKVKEESQDKDGASSRVETISGPESKVTDIADKYRPATANIGMYTEPKKPKKKKVDLIQPSFTEKKPTKTSMFSSSSSSEDLFEKFLEDEKKKRLNKLKRLERFEKLSTERFIYDGSSEEDENDLAFYNDFIGSEVKKDVDCLSEGKWSSHSAESSRSRHGHPRRLSFESQESGGSDRAAIDKALKTKKPRVKPKKRTPDKISKKHLPFRISPKHFLGSNKKTKSKKTATNSSKKTHEDKVIEQIKRINDNRKLEPTTPSTEKSSTKKVPKTPLTAQKPATGVVATPSSAKLRKELFSKTPAKTLSFLGSLSVLDDSDRCHPDAVQYKNNFKKLKEELAKKLFALYNREVFKNRILDSPDRLRDTLIHEMCHAATWLLDGVKDAHGPTWKNWTLEAMRRFPELPRIKVCHDYKIKTKYSYKCLGGGYSVGRHSKSLDIEHKRCGYCYGKFELLVNVKETADKKGNNKKRSDKESDTATSTSTQRALRAPTGFALFVKENYARTKQQNGNLVHKDVMKLLSEKFAQVKLTKAIKEDDEVIFVES
ncbi:hypothetical protein LSTR_LSTR000509 [Laodelphax striatellus]|uniref:SprT-like domain-containing protein n=1 Tax=Laodelphax striatellus TaxID=195883 RepID=A0A482WZW1_LAOST|nr:hypothetical protein LSTR_LSTR000509 [Laodelphax striatellus]